MRDHDENDHGAPPSPLYDQSDAQKQFAPPHSIEAEQAILGALLFDNDVFWRIGSWLEPKHFYDPLHARIYEVACDRIGAGQLGDAVQLKSVFDRDPGMAQIGGPVYLADLMREAPEPASAPEYGRLVHDLWLRRELTRLGDQLAYDACESVDHKPASALLESHESELFALTRGHGSGLRREAVSFKDSLGEAVQRVIDAHASGKGVSGLSTGLRSLDSRMGGLNRSDLIILAARPSMGKTALATNIAFAIARAFYAEDDANGIEVLKAGGRVLFFSLEMSADQLSARNLAEQTGVNTHRQRTGRVSHLEIDDLADTARQLETNPLWIDDTGGIDISQLCARARRHKRMHGLDIIVVDYLQLVRAKGYGHSKVQEVSEVTQRLKALAKELDVPVLALSQLSRQVEQRDNKKPQLSDLRESGSIEQDADVVMFVYREAYYLERLEPKEGTEEHLKWEDQMRRVANEAELILGKQRHGPIGSVLVHFEPERTRFTDLATTPDYHEAL